MKYERIKNLNDKKFRRITGVKLKTFEKMVDVLIVEETKRRIKGGPKPRLCIEDMLLAALEYWREYRTYAHIGVGFGLSESQIFRIVKWVEDVLIKSGQFSLPGKKVLLEKETEIEIGLIDATESPIERPKKNKVTTIPERKSDTP